MSHGHRAAFLALVCALAASPASAQMTTATLKGRVVDSEGTGLPGVPVTVTSRTHGNARATVVTDVEGAFRFRALPPAGDYVLAVNYPGFAPIEVGPIDLDPGKTTVQDVTLRSKEELTQRVEVTAHGSIVDTESTKTSTTFNVEYIEGLPIIGRNYQDILTLTPGVTDTDGDGNPNVQGARATGLQYRLDGGNITDPASGTFGQNLNLEIIEEIEVITAGASAEYGRADGGFANLITKSGGNEFEGSFKMFWRGQFLDGDGARENNDTIYTVSDLERNLRRLSPYLTAGGAIKKDKLWYFTSWQYVDRVEPLNLAGATIFRRARGHNGFGKLTWQVNTDNKVALQFNDDPFRFWGLFRTFGVEEDSDAVVEQGGLTTQLRWTSVISPILLLETLLTDFDSGIGLTPVSDLFHVTHVTTRVQRNNNVATLQAVYPLRECSIDGSVQGFITNCDPTRGDPSIYQQNLLNGTVSGPFPIKSDDTRTRRSIKSDLTLTLEDAWGEHQIRSGLEFSDEKFSDTPINNPWFDNLYRHCGGCTLGTGIEQHDAVLGLQVLNVPDPVVLQQNVVGFSSAAYVNDVWRPRQNVTIQAGLRIDSEDTDTSGFEHFNPRYEKRKVMGIVSDLCAEADRSRRAGFDSSWSGSCDPRSGFVPGQEPVSLKFELMPDAPEKVVKFDRNEDGVFDDATDGPVWREPFTVYVDREPENFEITNLNLSPRFAASWDPWADGRTRVFGTWGRHFDRFFLDTVRFEMGPDLLNFTFLPDPDTFEFEPGSTSRHASAPSITQVDRALRTPFTDIFTLGAEREVAPEWTVRLTYTQRLFWGLLQDVDINHLTCDQHDDVFGISPRQVCALYTDSKGKTHISDDLFGEIGTQRPNGAPDLYNVNPNYNQVLRIGNFNSGQYRSIALEVQRRLHRNWQLSGSYTWSRAIGNAEEFSSDLGDDPATTDDEWGYLDYDQRHRVVVYGIAHLPKDVEMGGTVTYESGTPYSIIRQVSEEDSADNVTTRIFFPTRQRNDQRNGVFWNLDFQTTKRFRVGNTAASAQITVQNILNMDDLTLSAYRRSSFDGVQLREGPQGLRRFGRIWELGVSFNF